MKSRSSWLAGAIALSALVLLAVILALIAARQENDYRRDYARSQVRNLALLLSEELGSRLRDVDDELRTEAAAAANGTPGGAGASAAKPHTGLGQLQGPLKDTQGHWVMRLERPSTNPGAPPVSRDIPVQDLGELLTKIELGEHGAATIRTQELGLVYRHPLPPGGLGRIGDAKVSKELQEALAQQPAQGEFVAQTALDGIARVNAYRRLDGYPLMVLVGVAESAFPSGWARIDRPLFALALVTLFTLIGALWALRRASRQALSDARRRADHIIENSNDAIVSKTLDGTVQTWNAAAERMLGWSAAEMIGRSIHTIVPEELQQQERELLQRVGQGEHVESLETERLHRDGRRIPMSVTVSPIRDGDGRVVGASKIGRDISRQKAMEQTIREMAYRDPLTGLPNRRYAMDQLAQAQAQSRRHGQFHGLVYVDLDGLKVLNDRHGHHEGDRYLVGMGQRLKGSLRESDIVARLGGDEFVALCLNLGPTREAAEQALEGISAKLRSALSQPWQVDGMDMAAGASLGTCAFDGQALVVEDLLRRADQRMYADKQSRKISTRAFSPTSASEHSTAP